MNNAPSKPGWPLRARVQLLYPLAAKLGVLHLAPYLWQCRALYETMTLQRLDSLEASEDYSYAVTGGPAFAPLPELKFGYVKAFEIAQTPGAIVAALKVNVDWAKRTHPEEWTAWLAEKRRLEAGRSSGTSRVAPQYEYLPGIGNVIPVPTPSVDQLRSLMRHRSE